MKIFRDEFTPAVEIQQLAREFLDMRQTIELVAEITAKFRERALLVPQYAGDKEMKKTWYHDMLRVDIQKYVSYSACPTLDDMIAKAQEGEIDIEHIRKRKTKIGQTTGVSMKKPKGFDSRSKGQQNQSRYGKCGKLGHFSKDCTAPTPTIHTSDMLCFHYN